ncbi:MAG: hypothetical protein II811_02730 [Spirochaetaceae bacterium]|nr:hypothetical protein [Spirochaetaceae bacterium]
MAEWAHNRRTHSVFYKTAFGCVIIGLDPIIYFYKQAKSEIPVSSTRMTN